MKYDDQTIIRMLDSAGKSFGLEGFEPQHRSGEGWVCIKPPDMDVGQRFQTVWAPLSDNGEAFELAAFHTMVVHFNVLEVRAYFIESPMAEQFEPLDDHDGDAARAGRFAIVKEAARMWDQGLVDTDE